MGMRYSAVAMSTEQAMALAESAGYDEWQRAYEAGIDLDKAWHAVQVLMAGGLEAQEPLLTGQPLGEEGAFFASPEDVLRVSGGLAGCTVAVMTERFDVTVMEEQAAYPGVWDEDPEELAEWIAGASMELVELYRSAAKAGLGIVAQVA